MQSFEKQLEQNRAENQKLLAQIDYDILRLSRMQQRRAPLVAAGYVPRETGDQIDDELAHNKLLRPLQADTNQRQDALRNRQMPGIRTELAGLPAEPAAHAREAGRSGGAGRRFRAASRP